MTQNKAGLNMMSGGQSYVGVAKMNESMRAEGKGSMTLETCEPKEVLHIPELRANLLSANLITENGGQVLFSKTKVITKQNDKAVLEGEKTKNGLYVLDLKTGNPTKVLLTENRTNKVTLRHRRMGHLHKGLKSLLKLSTGMDVINKEIDAMNRICDVCQISKQTKLSFGMGRTRATRPLEIIHTDLCGPIDPDTWDGKRYFLTFADDFTNYLMIYLLKTKGEVAGILKEHAEK